VLFSPTTPDEQRFYGADKLVHVGLFALLASTARLRFGRGLLLLLGYAVLSEVLQSTLPIHRDGGAADVVADVVGAALGWLGARPGPAWPRRPARN
jgi:VanZ family protein